MDLQFWIFVCRVKASATLDHIKNKDTGEELKYNQDKIKQMNTYQENWTNHLEIIERSIL
jgi:hypothetical protein